MRFLWFARRLRSGPLLAFFTISGLLDCQATARLDDFVENVAPILEQHCLQCHSPGISKGEVSLATAESVIDSGLVVPGSPGDSLLLEVITAHEDNRPRMPKAADPLTQMQVKQIREWIERGASWPADIVLREPSETDASWWSLQPIASSLPADPTTIDQLIDRRLHKDGLTRNNRSDRRTLIRRATYDLLGLPPTPEEIDQFLADESPEAFANLVDRLLASPHYGERWGRHWLDVVRFGESIGYERNQIVNDAWPFRDYVIQSLNADRPFDELIREHLAGDVLDPGNFDVEVGSVFLVAGPYDDVGNQDAVQAAQIRANTMDEIIRATSGAFLGLTVGCARCHDHKFDPILQEDYYSLYATFAGVRHGSRVIATDAQRKEREQLRRPLLEQRQKLESQRDALNAEIRERAEAAAAEIETTWTRPSPDRQGTEESFDSVEARYVRLVSEGQDININNRNGFGIDEFEVFSEAEPERNVALAVDGAVASGPSRHIEDFPGAYGPHLAIDGRTGERFLATGGTLTIELPRTFRVNRVRFSSARGESVPQHSKFAFVAEYRIETSSDGTTWSLVADSHDRRPVNEAHRLKRLQEHVTTQSDSAALAQLNRELKQLNQQLAEIPEFPSVWVGTRSATDAEGPFHVFVGGNPQRLGSEVTPSSLAVLASLPRTYRLTADRSEGERRLALADWITSPDNPLTPRVLANRVWHYHFGTGIVDTPNDLGYMGGRPTHPELLDWLAAQLIRADWKIKPLHRLIMLSETYQQSSEWDPQAAAVDGDSRLLWRFPPRRLSAEEVRDTVLAVSGKLNRTMGGPGFRLYKYLQDNVSTYVPLDEFGPETYRRSVYHQNARASRTDLMTDFDQPDCAFSAGRRAQTTTPLQALTMLNHDFTLDMASAFAERLQQEAGESQEGQVTRAWLLCFGRPATPQELDEALAFLDEQGLPALCRVLLNTSELIYVN